MMIIGVDTGGTFTDFVFKEGDRWGVYKSLSTPSNPARAVLEGLRHIAGGKVKRVIHGSTVATNAILEGKDHLRLCCEDQGGARAGDSIRLRWMARAAAAPNSNTQRRRESPA